MPGDLFENYVCFFDAFENNFGIKREFTIYLKESCWFASDQHFSSEYFHKVLLVKKI